MYSPENITLTEAKAIQNELQHQLQIRDFDQGKLIASILADKTTIQHLNFKDNK